MNRRSYHVVRTLGYGGFGTVYHARVEGEGGFTKDVALKIINPDAVTQVDVAQRMRDEARVLGLVRHRAIVHVDGLSRLAGRWTVVMELIEGADLRSLLKNGPVPTAAALEITREVASALHAAYHTPGQAGPLKLLHRDIKPSNLQLTPQGEVKILDFGIARADFEEREAATQGILYGTPDYMAPERFAFEETHAGDVYALGATLYEMVAGRPLGRTSALPERHEKHLALALLRLRESSPDGQDPEIQAFLTELLALTPEVRPSARDVERRCTTLLTRFATPSLRDWAEVAIPPVMEARKGFPLDPMLGSVLQEQTEGDNLTWAVGLEAGNRGGALPTLPMVPDPNADAPTLPRRKPRKNGLLVFVSLASLGVAGLAVWLWLRPAPVPTPAPSTEPTPRVVSLPPPATVTPPPTVPPPPELTPEKTLSKAPHPLPVLTPDTPEPTPPVVDPARIVVQGDATRVTLISEDGRFNVPGEVPPGSYTIEAEFPTRGPTQAGTLRVTAHATLTLTCKDAFGRCSTR